MLAAPTAPDERLPRVAARARGFVYAVGLLGVTGERAVAGRVGHRRWPAGSRRITDRPVLVGVGVSNAEQAARGVRRRRRRRPGRVGRAPADGGRPRRRRRLRRRGPGGDRRRDRSSDAAASDAACELCEAARLTEWFYEDDECWIAECESCSVPMVVWRVHDPRPARRRQGDAPRPAGRRRSAEHFEDEHYVDDNLRTIPTHYHAHARPRGGFLGRTAPSSAGLTAKSPSARRAPARRWRDVRPRRVHRRLPAAPARRPSRGWPFGTCCERALADPADGRRRAAADRGRVHAAAPRRRPHRPARRLGAGHALYPHDHRMWAAIGIYAGQEDNAFYRRTGAGGRDARRVRRQATRRPATSPCSATTRSTASPTRGPA